MSRLITEEEYQQYKKLKEVAEQILDQTNPGRGFCLVEELLTDIHKQLEECLK